MHIRNHHISLNSYFQVYSLIFSFLKFTSQYHIRRNQSLLNYRSHNTFVNLIDSASHSRFLLIFSLDLKCAYYFRLAVASLVTELKKMALESTVHLIGNASCPFKSWMSKNVISSCICLLDKQHISSISSLSHILSSFSPIVPIILPLSKSIPKRRWFIACFGIYRTIEISLGTEKKSFIWWAYSRMAMFSASAWNNCLKPVVLA